MILSTEVDATETNDKAAYYRIEQATRPAEGAAGDAARELQLTQGEVLLYGDPSALCVVSVPENTTLDTAMGLAEKVRAATNQRVLVIGHNTALLKLTPMRADEAKPLRPAEP